MRRIPPRYGTHAQAVLPQLQEIRGQLATEAPNARRDLVEQLDGCIATIEACTTTPTLVSLEEFQARPSLEGTPR